MQHVETLSRAPVEKSNLKIMSIETREDEILMFQKADPMINEIITILNNPESKRTN